ncbi:MAG TPA: hypothetical protein VG433_10080 [Pirellulales bacterium]|nr:hypothetical protein [Pirellulales bacterium]
MQIELSYDDVEVITFCLGLRSQHVRVLAAEGFGCGGFAPARMEALEMRLRHAKAQEMTLIAWHGLRKISRAAAQLTGREYAEAMLLLQSQTAPTAALRKTILRDLPRAAAHFPRPQSQSQPNGA